MKHEFNTCKLLKLQEDTTFVGHFLDIETIIFNIITAFIAVSALILSMLTYKRHSRITVKIRMPLLHWLEDLSERMPALGLGSFPFSSLEDGIEHLKWIPIEVHNESQERSISANMLWVEIFDNSPNQVSNRMPEGRIRSPKVNRLEVSLKEHLPISIEAGHYATIHLSIRTAAEIWKNHIHQVGTLKLRHSFGTAATEPIDLDLFWEYYSHVAHFVSEEILKREVDSLSLSKMHPDRLVDYAASIYGKVGFVPDLGVIELVWILKERASKHLFFALYLKKAEERQKLSAKLTQNMYKEAIERREVKPPEKGEIIPILVSAVAVPKNIQSTLELIEQLEAKRNLQ
jgi:hypothetical protein